MIRITLIRVLLWAADQLLEPARRRLDQGARTLFVP
jgi:hypothetical protein